MIRSKEEIKAELVWLFVDCVREQDEDKAPVSFSDEELAELVGVLQTASEVPPALTVPDSAERRESVRSRLDGMLDEREADLPTPSQRPRRKWAGLLNVRLTPAWSFATALVLGISLTAATAGAWHPQPVKIEIKTKRVPVQLTDIEPMDEVVAHRLIHQTLRHEISQKQEKDLMWHMLVCKGCFREYWHLKQQTPVADADLYEMAAFYGE